MRRSATRRSTRHGSVAALAPSWTVGCARHAGALGRCACARHTGGCVRLACGGGRGKDGVLGGSQHVGATGSGTHERMGHGAHRAPGPDCECGGGPWLYVSGDVRCAVCERHECPRPNGPRPRARLAVVPAPRSAGCAQRVCRSGSHARARRCAGMGLWSAYGQAARRAVARAVPGHARARRHTAGRRRRRDAPGCAGRYVGGTDVAWARLSLGQHGVWPAPAS